MKTSRETKKYQISGARLREIEDSVVAYGVYQVIDNRVVPLALSGGFFDMFGIPKDRLYNIMSEDMFVATHPNDIARYQRDTYNFISHPEELYSTSCRIKIPKNDYYVILRAQGRHKILEDGTDLCVIWYTMSSLPADDITLRNNEQERREMEELRKENKNIRKLYYDILTSLPNMSMFLQLAGAAAKEAEEKGDHFIVMAFDLAGMKHFNSKYGIQEGDRLLRAFAGLLRKHFGNECCSRFGEDHFYAFSMKEDVESDIEEVFEELQTANSGNNLPVKVGICDYSDRETPVASMCDRAKIALDFVKKDYESNFVYFDESMEAAVEYRNYILDHLDQALKERWIKVYYQPIIRAVTGRLCNEEALARWKDPTLGVILPEDFVHIIEDAKILYKLDLYMVDCIVDDIKKYKLMNEDLLVPVTVNISRYDFEYCDMVSEITRRVKDAGVSPKYLIIEITESVMGLDPEFLREQVGRFHKNGFKVWMDDFGSGYSNLNVLQDFDFDLIKLDIHFMMNFGKSQKNRGIIIKIIEMAEQLGVDTLAEGVETAEQVAFLKDVGCDKIQGQFYSTPNPMDEILQRYGLGVSLVREKMEEADYYDKIGQASLDDPNINSDASTKIAQHFTGIGVAIMEYNGNDQYRILRANKIYKNYLKIMYGPEVQFEGFITYSDRERHHVYKESVERCIASGNWEAAYDIISLKNIKINTNTRVIARDPVTGAYALMVVIASEKRDKNDLKGYESIGGILYQSESDDSYFKNPERKAQRQTVDEVTLRIVEHINASNRYDNSISLILKEISTAIHPEDIFVLEKDGDSVSSIYRCVGGEVVICTDRHRAMEYSFYSQLWDECLEKQGKGISGDAFEVKDANKDLYFELNKHGITRFILVPVLSKGNVIGYVGADNFRLDEKEDSEYILSTVAGFLSFSMANNILVERLTYVAEHDTLTSCYNRNAMMKREREVAETGGSVGVVFADVNGLKFVNDNYGHDEGDRLIIRAADFMAKHYGRENLYRIGGDEFVALIPGIEKAVFDRKRYSLLQDLAAMANLSMATGFVWEPDIRNITGSLKEADKRMYEDKAEYYEHHDRRHKVNK